MNTFKMEPYGETPNDYPTKEMKDLFEAVFKLDTITDISNFFRDLLTMPELKEFANRWQIVLLLEKGVPYKEIAEQLKVSTTTVTRVAYWLHNGFGGYAKVVKDMRHQKKQKELKSRIPQNEFDRSLQTIARLRK